MATPSDPKQRPVGEHTVADPGSGQQTVIDSQVSGVTMKIGEPPPVVGGWTLGKRLGVGGMGAVHLATKGGQQGALKLMHAQLIATGDFRARFLREAEVLRAVRHPNVVQLIDHGEDAGWLWLVMEYVPGGDLAQHLGRRGQLFEKEAASIAVHCCRGLQAIHAAGLIHRDLKPENVFLIPSSSGSPVPKIGDLGMARHSGGDDRMTLTGTACGTPAYMAPEQIRGSGDLDARCDVYALGATLFTLFTGRKPFEGPTIYVLTHEVLTKPVPDIRKWNPQISPGACAVVEKAMAKDRAARHKDIGELLLDLERIAEGKSPLLSAVLPSPASMVFQDVVGQSAPKRSQAPSIGSGASTSFSEIPWGAVLRMAVPAVILIGLLTGVSWILESKTKAPPVSSGNTPSSATSGAHGTMTQDDRGALVRLPIAAQSVTLRWCPPGSFTMGSPTTEMSHSNQEDIHHVKLTRGFWILDREVTNAVWNALGMEGTAPTSDSSNNPVTNVNLDQCQDWLDRFNHLHPQLNARLPSEAEWEYACRAGGTGPFSVDGQLRLCTHPQVLSAWRSDSGGLFAAEGARMLDPEHPLLRPVPTASTAANTWSIFGMHDNVAEWCSDRWDGESPYGDQPRTDPTSQFGSLNVVRGGSWLHPPERSRSAARSAADPGSSKPWLGFRFVIPGGQTANWPPR
ncbi:MAG: bifunctional serine/threonine-protein kinase/formylglycine-generating enzyme family protein [Planctomycetota bacterium]